MRRREVSGWAVGAAAVTAISAIVALRAAVVGAGDVWSARQGSQAAEVAVQSQASEPLSDREREDIAAGPSRWGGAVWRAAAARRGNRTSNRAERKRGAAGGPPG